MTNTKFITIRKCYGFEWESYKDTKTNDFFAICHAFSKTVFSKTWDGLWDEILDASRHKRKMQRSKRSSNKT